MSPRCLPVSRREVEPKGQEAAPVHNTAWHGHPRMALL